MKPCPFCAEEIQDAATFCRFCNHDLTTGTFAIAPVAAPAVPIRYWHPGVAAVLSLFIPGSGLIYKGQVAFGILWLFLTAAGYLFFVVPGVVLHLVGVAISVSGDPTIDPSRPVARGDGGEVPKPQKLTPEQVMTERARERRDTKRALGLLGAVLGTFALVMVVIGFLSHRQHRDLQQRIASIRAVDAAAAEKRNEEGARQVGVYKERLLEEKKQAEARRAAADARRRATLDTEIIRSSREGLERACAEQAHFIDKTAGLQVVSDNVARETVSSGLAALLGDYRVCLNRRAADDEPSVARMAQRLLLVAR